MSQAAYETTSVIRDPVTAVERAYAYARDERRLAMVNETGLLDQGIQESLQRFTRLAAELVPAPTSLVTIIDRSRQYFSAAHGFTATETPLALSFCKHVVAEDEQLAVEDTHEDAVFATNPMTAAGVRAYMGSPLRVDGERVGSFCVADTEPRVWDERQRRIIDDLAAAASTDIELRIQLRRQSELATRDSLTGLGNRRALDEALEERFGSDREFHLAILDLDGFKAYNERFGHQAGDELLRRLGVQLIAAAGAHSAFRAGGDEFYVLGGSRRVITDAAAALEEEGAGFAVTASVGTVRLPAEASDPRAALALADARLSAVKRLRPGAVDDQVAAALAGALAERVGVVDENAGDLALYARSVGEELGLDEVELRRVELSARLADVGKVAVPDSVLLKPGPLNHVEWSMMRGHTLIGERILASVPALADLGPLVRSSHERYDGAGYPDGLSGDEIPLGSMIIFACDAYQAMTGGRTYAEVLPVKEAIAELQRGSGSQFDPAVAEALISVVERSPTGGRDQPLTTA